MIPFTQFLRPDGRRRAITIVRPAEIEAKARDLAHAGCEFQIEELTTGDVSMEVTRDELGETECLAGELCPNGPEVLSAVDRMIENAWTIITNA